jgi:hypothetical protein
VLLLRLARRRRTALLLYRSHGSLALRGLTLWRLSLLDLPLRSLTLRRLPLHLTLLRLPVLY